MAIDKVNISTETVSDFVTAHNNTCDAIITGGTHNGTTLSLATADGNISIGVGTYKQKGLVAINGTQVTISTSNVSASSKIIMSVHTVTSGTPGVLWIESINPATDFTIESTASFNGYISYLIID